MIRVQCPSCGDRLNLKDSMGGKRIRCPECQAVIAVPDAETLTVAPPPEPAALDFASSEPQRIEHKARSPFRTAFAVGAGWSLATILVAVGLIAFCIVLCCGVPLLFFGIGASKIADEAQKHPPVQPQPAEATPAKPLDDLTHFVARYGKPDEDYSSESERPRPPFLSRMLTYKKERVKALYVPEEGMAAVPPVAKWKLVGFVDLADGALDPAEVVRRMAARDREQKRR